MVLAESVGRVQETAAGEIGLAGLAVEHVVPRRVDQPGRILAAVAKRVGGGEAVDAARVPLVAELAVMRLADKRLIAPRAPQVGDVLPAGRGEGIDGVEPGHKVEPARPRQVAAVVVAFEEVAAGRVVQRGPVETGCGIDLHVGEPGEQVREACAAEAALIRPPDEQVVSAGVAENCAVLAAERARSAVFAETVGRVQKAVAGEIGLRGLACQGVVARGVVEQRHVLPAVAGEGVRFGEALNADDGARPRQGTVLRPAFEQVIRRGAPEQGRVGAARRGNQLHLLKAADVVEESRPWMYVREALDSARSLPGESYSHAVWSPAAARTVAPLMSCAVIECSSAESDRRSK